MVSVFITLGYGKGDMSVYRTKTKDRLFVSLRNALPNLQNEDLETPNGPFTLAGDFCCDFRDYFKRDFAAMYYYWRFCGDLKRQ